MSADFLETVGTRVVRGRGFDDGDRAGSQRVVLVNEAMEKDSDSESLAEKSEADAEDVARFGIDCDFQRRALYRLVTQYDESMLKALDDGRADTFYG